MKEARIESAANRCVERLQARQMAQVAASHCCRAAIQKPRNGRYDPRWRERLFQKDAVGHTARGPLIRSRAGHVNDRERRVDFPDLSCDIPTAQPALQVNIGNKRLVDFGLGP